MKNKCISIIIPTFNEKKNIENLVNWLVKYGEGALKEVIVVDAASSTDEIESLILPSIVSIVKSNYTARSSQFIQGAQLAQGAILYFLHADTLPPKTYGVNIVKMFERGVDFGMFSYRFDKSKWNLNFNGWMTQWKAFYTGGGDQGLFIFKEKYEAIGGFDKNKIIMEDYDLFWRLKKSKYTYQILKHDAIVSARKYDKNSSLKINLVNFVVLWWFRFGGNQEKIKDFYTKNIH